MSCGSSYYRVFRMFCNWECIHWLQPLLELNNFFIPHSYLITLPSLALTAVSPYLFDWALLWRNWIFIDVMWFQPWDLQFLHQLIVETYTGFLALEVWSSNVHLLASLLMEQQSSPKVLPGAYSQITTVCVWHHLIGTQSGFV